MHRRRRCAKGAGVGTTANSGWTKKTPWGDPDIQGIWNNGTTTPLARPAALADKAELSSEEFAAKQKEDARRQAEGETEEERKQGLGAGPTFWYEIGKTTNRTSLITDPPNGQLPALTPQAQALLAERKQNIAEIPLEQVSLGASGPVGPMHEPRRARRNHSDRL